MNSNRLLEVLARRTVREEEPPRLPAEELRDRLLNLSRRELDWLLELLSFLGEEAWRAEREEVARTVSEILMPEKPVGTGGGARSRT